MKRKNAMLTLNKKHTNNLPFGRLFVLKEFLFKNLFYLTLLNNFPVNVLNANILQMSQINFKLKAFSTVYLVSLLANYPLNLILQH